jgi:hypothetical protein
MAPDVIFVTTNPVVSALMQVTRTIPIVFTWVSYIRFGRQRIRCKLRTSGREYHRFP